MEHQVNRFMGCDYNIEGFGRTANRHDEGPDSLEATIRALNVPSSLPVLTMAEPELVLASRDYAERVATQVLEYLVDLDHFRGVGRLFVP
jgi:hypothetical protein